MTGLEVTVARGVRRACGPTPGAVTGWISHESTRALRGRSGCSARLPRHVVPVVAMMVSMKGRVASLSELTDACLDAPGRADLATRGSLYSNGALVHTAAWPSLPQQVLRGIIRRYGSIAANPPRNGCQMRMQVERCSSASGSASADNCSVANGGVLRCSRFPGGRPHNLGARYNRYSIS